MAHTVDASSHDFLAERASQIGDAWAKEYLLDLRSRSRAAVGAWPGTMSEARSRVVSKLAQSETATHTKASAEALPSDRENERILFIGKAPLLNEGKRTIGDVGLQTR